MCASIIHSFFMLSSLLNGCMRILSFLLSPVDKRLSFQFWTITNKASMNIHVQDSMCCNGMAGLC